MLTIMKLLRQSILGMTFGVLVGMASSPVVAPEALASPDRQARRELLAQQRAELKDLDRSQKAELADLKASQKARRKQFESEGRTERRECFKRATRGSEKRTCVESFLARRKALIQLLSEEMSRRKGEQKVRRRSLEEEHQRKLVELDRGGAAAPAAASAQ